jgi:hypothetical protein
MNELSFTFNSISTFWYSMTEVSCHVYKLKVSQDHTNSTIDNNSPYRQLVNNVLETFKQIEQIQYIHLELQR